MSSQDTVPTPRTLRRANDCFEAATLRRPQPLFDDLWREGELALLFGVSTVGKSLLAVTIAEALARGRPIEGLEMPERGRSVLYIDLVLSDDQFANRYSYDPPRGERRGYGFSARFFRDAPLPGEKLIDWLRMMVAAHKVSTVVIDDLSMISRSDDGTRETLELLIELRRMTRQRGISVLVLADSHPWAVERTAAERDLRRRRVLCAYADSVFALERAGTNGRRHLIQTRTQADRLTWPRHRPAHFQVTSHDNGFVSLQYYELDLTDEQREMSAVVRRMHATGDTFRTIAAKLGISRSAASRLDARWRPEFERFDGPNVREYAHAVIQAYLDSGRVTDSYPGEFQDRYLIRLGLEPIWWQKYQREQAAAEAEAEADADAEADRLPDDHEEREMAAAAGCDEGFDAEGCGTDNDPELLAYLQEVGLEPGPADGMQDGPSPESVEDAENGPGPAALAGVRYGFDPTRVPFAAALRRRSIHDLERDRDHNGIEIYVESRDERGRPRVWYCQRPRGGNWVKWTRDGGGRSGTTWGASPLLPRKPPIAPARSYPRHLPSITASARGP